jgi:hypothetical protein
MILYTEKQLEDCYRQYCLHQIRHDMPFMQLEDFRNMFEDIMKMAYKEPEKIEGEEQWH